MMLFGQVLDWTPLIVLSFLLICRSGASSSHASLPKKVVIGVDGGTESIRACCFDAHTGSILGESCAVPYTTSHPRPGWAEQDPKEWYTCLSQAVRTAVASLASDNEDEGEAKNYELCGICMDTTCCSVVALDKENEPLRPCLLWMDARSAPQAKYILDKCKGDPALSINCGGEGPISAEWMTPKALWIKQQEPDIWDAAATICEYQDYLNYKLTGNWCASSCNAATRWHWNGVECLKDATPESPHPGRPIGLYEKLGIPELADKLPSNCLPMGSQVGRLNVEAAADLGLPVDLPVAQGGPDAFVGMLGLGCVKPKQLCLITGSSHLHCVVTSETTTSLGVWGSYAGAPLPQISFAEGGQSSTGSILRWAKGKLFGDSLSYKDLDDEASSVPAGSDGLVALETFQGSRTPVTDPLARGSFVGLTLSHTRGHIWRALCESICFGTKACIDALEKAGHSCEEIIMAGGATRSPLWLQLHSDITGKPVILCNNSDCAPLLGCAILASVNAGIHNSVDDAVKAMVQVRERIEPNSDLTGTYAELFEKTYSPIAKSIQPIAHNIASIRGGASRQEDIKISPKKSTVISPSLLAADWANIQTEIEDCVKAGSSRLHIDIFDGVFIDSPLAFTFGPKMVGDMRRCSQDTILDLHMCVDRPERFVEPMKDAGASTFIFMWEAMADSSQAMQLSEKISKSGMKCGVSINPSTSVEEILPLLRTGLVSVVDVLAVEAGFGGQKFQDNTIAKVLALRNFRGAEAVGHFDIMVDGGINETTAGLVPADILVAGSYLFQHPQSLEHGIRSLIKASESTHIETISKSLQQN